MNKKSLLSCLLPIAISSTGFANPGDSGKAGNLPPPQVTITEEGSFRVIRANGIPNHPVGQFPGAGNPNAISAQNYTFRMPLHPVTNATFATIRMQAIGVAVNGIPFDPGTAEFWNHDPKSGWHIEGIIGQRRTFGLDQNNAHVQPNGAYHYHGIPTGLVHELGGGSGAMTLLGYAADGFPVYGPLAFDKPNEATGTLREMKPGWQLKKGSRPGGNGPGGAYDGTYTQDFEFIAGSGDLDEANGRNGVTPEYPQGTYYYVATETFPFYPRVLKGTPDPSFKRLPPARTSGQGGGPPRFFQGTPDRPGPPR